MIGIVEIIIAFIAYPIGAIFEGIGLNEMDTILLKIEAMLEIVIENGIKLTALVIDLNYVKFLIGIVITIETAEIIYRILMWILMKIPLLAIE